MPKISVYKNGQELLDDVNNKAHNCIYLYLDRLHSGKYVIFKIETDDGKISWLGVEQGGDSVQSQRKWRYESRGWHLSQHYFARNEPVNQEHIDIADKLIKKLNEKVDKFSKDAKVEKIAMNTGNQNA